MGIRPSGSNTESHPMRRLLIATMISAFCATTALAQTTTPATKPPAETKAKKEKAPAKPRTAASLECSKQADAQGLKGKERKKFRAKCKRDMAKKT
jgi:hypothetical protein